MDRQNEGSEDPPQGGWSCWTWEVSCHIGMGIHRSHLKRIVMTLYLVYPLLLYICPVWGKDHSITVILFNDRYQKVLNLLKKNTWLYGEVDSNIEKVALYLKMWRICEELSVHKSYEVIDFKWKWWNKIIWKKKQVRSNIIW